MDPALELLLSYWWLILIVLLLLLPMISPDANIVGKAITPIVNALARLFLGAAGLPV